jgi:hypothetical protein
MAVDYLESEQNTTLTSPQVRLIWAQKHKHTARTTETFDLEAEMRRTEGFSAVMEVQVGEVKHRSAIATFTPTELENLANFGDVIAIDPTFLPLYLGWSVIPLTVIGKAREIRSAGLIMSATTDANVFEWILHMLTHDLPCKEILVTIISDDDRGLNSAFDNTPDSKITELNRVICFWHKISCFVRIVARSRNKAEMISVFRRAGTTKHPDEYKRCMERILELSGDLNNSVRNFLNEVEDQKQSCTRAFARFWSLGYITSSIAESANSRLKSQMSLRSQSLLDVRQAVTRIELQSENNREYLKHRKVYKIKDQIIQRMLEKANVHRKKWN